MTNNEKTKDLTEEKTEEKKVNTTNISVEELGKAGLHFGHGSSKRHPNMNPYIEGVKGDIHIIDLTKTAEKMDQALAFLKDQKKQGKTIMIVGTKPQTVSVVEEVAKKNKLPFITNRWIGGFITNFNEIKKRINLLNGLLKKKESGELEKYTKKERLEIDRDIEGLQKKFGGVMELTSVPDVLFALNMDKDELAIEEAKKMGMKIVTICDTNCDPTKVDYPIPANDDAISSIEFILKKLDKAIN